jgi:hypothetical protein
VDTSGVQVPGESQDNCHEQLLEEATLELHWSYPRRHSVGAELWPGTKQLQTGVTHDQLLQKLGCSDRHVLR